MQVEVTKVTLCKDGKTFMTKIISEKTEKVLGVDMSVRSTFYMFLQGKLDIGFKGEIDLSKFDQVPQPRTFTNDDGEVITRKLTYLYLKRG